LRRTPKLWLLIVAAVVLCVPLWLSLGQAQSPGAAPGSTAGGVQLAQASGSGENQERALGESLPVAPPQSGWLDTLVQLWKSAGLIGYLIFIVFLIGVFLAMDEARIIWLDRVRSRPLVSRDFRRLAAPDQRILLASARPSRLLGLLRDLHGLKETRLAEQELKGEIHRQVNFFHDKFNSFLSRLDFLSDTSGALGLLGTVWGIYVAFTEEALARGDINLLIKSMGLALSTTFLGLVASIVLNLLSTEVYNLHNQVMAVMTEKGEEYVGALQGAAEPVVPR